MRIGFLGDVHGDSRWADMAASAFADEGVEYVIQVGDFGLYPPKDSANADQHFLKKAEEYFGGRGIRLDVVPGNHENYDFIERLQEQQDGRLAVSPSISVLPRGFRWEVDGVNLVALGGAPSVDRQYRLRLERDSRFGEKYWWEQEAITQEDVDITVEGGHATIMVGHDAPHCYSIDARIKGNPHGFAKVDLEYAEAGRKLMTEAYYGVKPSYFFHGHYHFPVRETIDFDDETQGQIIGLDMNHANRSMATYDTETEEITILDVGKHKHKYYEREIRKRWS